MALFRELGETELYHGKLKAAENNTRESLSAAEGGLPIIEAASLALLGRVLVAMSRPAEAEHPLRRSLEIRKQGLPEGHWLVAETESLLGGCLSELNRYDEAEPLLTTSYEAIANAKGLCAARKIEALQARPSCISAGQTAGSLGVGQEARVAVA